MRLQLSSTRNGPLPERSGHLNVRRITYTNDRFLADCCQRRAGSYTPLPGLLALRRITFHGSIADPTL